MYTIIGEQNVAKHTILSHIVKGSRIMGYGINRMA